MRLTGTVSHGRGMRLLTVPALLPHQLGGDGSAAQKSIVCVPPNSYMFEHISRIFRHIFRDRSLQSTGGLSRGRQAAQQCRGGGESVEMIDKSSTINSIAVQKRASRSCVLRGRGATIRACIGRGLGREVLTHHGGSRGDSRGQMGTGGNGKYTRRM